jgi:cyclic pyranopterin phosphate synthase
MIDITHKSSTLRVATAEAVVHVGSAATIEAVQNKTVPKGDVLEMAKTAGLFAVKNTANSIPDCHPLPIEKTTVEYEIKGLDIHIRLSVSTVYKTGVEVEAMHGASVVALTMYDMLKPIDKKIEIQNIRLIGKKGGKSDFKKDLNDKLTAAVIVCSDSISAGKKTDRAGLLVKEKLEKHLVNVPHYDIIPDEPEDIVSLLNKYSDEEVNLIIYAGGTGLSKRDVTPESVQPHLDREIPGIAEAMRSYGMDRTPYSMLSRSLAGTKGKSLVLALPGSTGGAGESMDALLPGLLHIFKVFEGLRHN